ncbi:hypothetical protein L208DRAFT_1099720, partial [Tricholoma matsutake]
CVTGPTICHVGECFQCANGTISHYFQLMLTIFSSPPFYTNLVHLPHETDPIPSEICDNPKHYPFFCDAIGAIDGTYIACAPSEREHAATWNRK